VGAEDNGEKISGASGNLQKKISVLVRGRMVAYIIFILREGKTMRSAITSLAILLCLLSVFACSKPESKLVGTWINEKTSSSMEFNSDKTGIIHQRTQIKIPADLPFKWTMLGDKQFRVEVTVPGAPAPATAEGRLEGSDTLVLQNDTFRRMK
jgi:hypothetical protein